MDQNGKWVAQPIFEEIRYKFHNGFFAFCNILPKEEYVIDDEYFNEEDDDFEEEYEENEEDNKYGIYDSNLQKELIKPQFVCVNFLEDDLFQVSVFDKDQDKHIEKIIDSNGKEQFNSIYSLFFELNSKYLSAGIWDENGNRKFGVIDKKGNIIYPCEEGIGPADFYYEQNRIRFFNKEGKSIKNFAGEVLVSPIYNDIYYMRKPLLGVTGKNNLEGLITSNGKVVIPTEFYSISWLQDDKHILCCREGFCQMLEYIEKTTEQ